VKPALGSPSDAVKQQQQQVISSNMAKGMRSMASRATAEFESQEE
jgi:hypothetical protein